MGKAGRADVKYGIDGAGPPGEFSSGTWLGAVYRCDTGGSESGGPADRVSVVGQTGPEQDPDADESKASDLESASSKPIVCLPRILRMPPFQPGQPLSGGTRRDADRLADRKYRGKSLR